jgi:integrase
LGDSAGILIPHPLAILDTSDTIKGQRGDSKPEKTGGMTMARRELNWYAPRKGYSKTIGGKRHYFALGRCKGPEDQEGYRQALREYLELRDKQDQKEAKQIESLAQTDRLPNGSTVDLTVKYINWGALEDVRGTGGTEDRATYQTIDGLVAAYLEHRKLLADGRQIQLKTYMVEKYRVANFLSFCHYKGLSSLRDTLSPEFLGDYKAKLLTAMGQGKASDSHVHNNLRTLKACLQWAWDEELIEKLPRKIRDYARIKMEAPKPLFFTPEEVQTLYGKAAERTKLFILMGLNLGYTQVDIATLEHGMIDWSKGLVTRKRHKTGQPQQAKVWPLTLSLLRKFATNSKQHKLVLIGENGNPLLVERLNEDQKPVKVDSIRLAFERLKAKTKINGRRGFKTFRKTGANQIAEHYQDSPHLVDLYLGHSEKTVRKHYTDRHFDQIFSATDWLATVFGFDKIEKE